uniref:GRAM domain-containing protein 2B-like n=1 Tax=Mastacembelus armatus TaxID=205130 RepID=A0A3Q3KV35_9TELE
MVLMTEQGDGPLTPSPTLEQLFNKDSRGTRPTPEVENGGERRQRSHVQSPADPQVCLDPEPEPAENRRKPASMRLKPVVQLSPMLTPVDFEVKLEKKKTQPSQLSKTNAQYHKLFTEVSQDELLKQSYTCALQKEILYQGRIFVSDNWICFYSRVFGKDTKISVPVVSVKCIRKTKTALLVPNALVIETTSEQLLFVSFLSRNTTYKLLKSICIHLEDDKTCTSPITSSCDTSFRANCPSSLPLDLSFSDLDGVVQQRRQEMMESSSSGSQTPDYDKVTVSSKPTHGVTLKDKSSQPMPLHAILLIYLFLVSVLVLSSCYMAFKIVDLEHRLNSLVSSGEHIRNENAVSHRSQEEVNAEIYGELAINLFTLEKIQRNLQKLLEET